MTAAAEKFASFNKVRAEFMRRASAPNVTPFALKLAYVLAFKYMNRETGIARPAQETLARDLNVTSRTIRTLLDILEPLGLTIIPGHGPNRSSSYCIDPDKATRAPDNRKPASASNRKPASASGSNTGKPVHDNRKLDDTNTGSQLPPNLTKRTKNRTKGRKRERALAPPDGDLGGKGSKSPAAEGSKADAAPEPQAEVVPAMDDAFARLWSVYPRKVNQADARKEFAKAVEGGADIELMIARATCYALERAAAIAGGDDPKWTPYLVKWLKQQKWNDPFPEGVIRDEVGNVVGIEQEEDDGEDDYETRLANIMGRPTW